MAGPAHFIPILVMVLAIVFLRIRRTVTSQPINRTRLVTRIVVLALIGIFLVMSSGSQGTLGLLGVLGGIVVGLALAYLSLRHTIFTIHSNQVLYKANPYIGALVIALLIARIFVDAPLYTHTALHEAGPTHVTLNPLSLVLYFIFVAYWIAYYLGVMRRAREMAPPPKIS